MFLSGNKIPFLVFCFSLWMLSPFASKANDNSSAESNALEILNANAAVNEYFMHQKNYIPGEPLNQGLKTIYLYFNVWQRDDGSGNFEDIEPVHDHFHLMVKRLNDLFSRSVPPKWPVEGVEYLRDSHIRFELKGIDFYRNSELHEATCGSGTKLNNYVFERSPEKRKYLNIHFTSGSCRGASGYASYPSGRDTEKDQYVVSFVRQEFELDEYPFWAFMVHVAHEIGHTLELRHPYDSEYCGFNHPDFLFDLFGYEKQEWCNNPKPGCDVCYHQKGWSCVWEDPETICTNNIMGGNKSAGSITPLQMGRMNRALALKSIRKYTWGYSDQPLVIDKSQRWDFNMKFYQDIRVGAGVTLEVAGTLEMVPEARIILEPGSRLVVDDGLITGALYSERPWQGIHAEPAAGRGIFFWRKKQPVGRVELINKGNITNHRQ